jgi:hypothetical protein
MNSLFDTSQIPPTGEELAAVQQNARERLRLWKRRSIYSGIALVLSCASVAPFLYGHPLHVYWESFGKYLVLLSMGFLVVFVYCAALFWAAWSALRGVEMGRI